jgi:2-amino-4-hydroxy-6-hydroxymethyldihydropteridine diphosphokinase
VKENYTKNIFLSLGSNLGDRKQNINKAIESVSDLIGTVWQSSSIYETEAWGNTSLQPFLNSIIEVNSALSSNEILEKINKIESMMGRVRKEKWEPRVIDIDIIFYDHLSMQTDQLTVPHPLMQNRKFVLAPLVEIAPDFVHPVLKKTMKKLLNECEDQLKVWPIKD